MEIKYLATVTFRKKRTYFPVDLAFLSSDLAALSYRYLHVERVVAYKDLLLSGN